MKLRSGKILGEDYQGIVGYKVCFDPIANRRKIVKLLIPPWAKTNMDRTNIVNSRFAKYRCSEARVLSIDPPGPAVSMWDGKTVYKVGKVMRPNTYFPYSQKVCAGGIHFFLDRERAELYELSKPSKGWFDNGQLEFEIIPQGSQGEAVRTVWYESGALRRRVAYRDVQKYGIWLEWYPTGQLWREGSYKNGRKHGVWREWKKDGGLGSQLTYRDGLIV